MNPGLAEDKARVAEEIGLYLDPVLSYFYRLQEEISGMPIAERFSPDTPPNHRMRMAHKASAIPHLENLSAAEYKRAQLQIGLDGLINQARSLIGGVESLVMDIQTTKREG
jgi:hypothetical protein